MDLDKKNIVTQLQHCINNVSHGHGPGPGPRHGHGQGAKVVG